METLVVVDKKVTEYYRQHHDVRHPDGLTAYVLTIMNIVSSYSRLPARPVCTLILNRHSTSILHWHSLCAL